MAEIPDNSCELKEGECILTCSLYIEKLFREKLNLEIEMLQGERVVIGEDMVRLKFTVDGLKAEMVKELILKLISQSPILNLN